MHVDTTTIIITEGLNIIFLVFFSPYIHTRAVSNWKYVFLYNCDGI